MSLADPQLQNTPSSLPTKRRDEALGCYGRPGGYGGGPNTRSHPELGRETRLRQWYFGLSRGRVGRRQVFHNNQHHANNTDERLSRTGSQIQTGCDLAMLRIALITLKTTIQDRHLARGGAAR
jgi:hypothetical protein